MDTILLVIHIMLTLALVVIILVQHTSTDGLGGIGGGSSNANLLSGRASANLMTRTTAVLAGLFLLNSLILATFASRGADNGSLLDGISADSPISIEGTIDPNKPAVQPEPLVPIAE